MFTENLAKNILTLVAVLTRMVVWLQVGFVLFSEQRGFLLRIFYDVVYYAINQLQNLKKNRL